MKGVKAMTTITNKAGGTVDTEEIVRAMITINNTTEEMARKLMDNPETIEWIEMSDQKNPRPEFWANAIAMCGSEKP